MSEIEKAIEVLKKFHDSALQKIHSDFLQNPKKYQTDGVPQNFICEAESIRLAIDTAISVLEKRKSGELVKVVRCKDCEFWEEKEGYFPICTIRSKSDYRPYKDGFCSYGERKGGSENGL